jgi:hypothetical protein
VGIDKTNKSNCFHTHDTYGIFSQKDYKLILPLCYSLVIIENVLFLFKLNIILYDIILK